MKDLKKISLALLAAVFLAGCAEGLSKESKKIIGKDNGGFVELAAGNSLIVELPGNPSTGFVWETESVDGAVLRQAVSYTPFKSDSNVIGAPGKITLRFKAIGSGKTALKLVYHRPWEKNAAPLKTYQVNIEVK